MVNVKTTAPTSNGTESKQQAANNGPLVRDIGWTSKGRQRDTKGSLFDCEWTGGKGRFSVFPQVLWWCLVMFWIISHQRAWGRLLLLFSFCLIASEQLFCSSLACWASCSYNWTALSGRGSGNSRSLRVFIIEGLASWYGMTFARAGHRYVMHCSRLMCE